MAACLAAGDARDGLVRWMGGDRDVGLSRGRGGLVQVQWGGFAA